MMAFSQFFGCERWASVHHSTSAGGSVYGRDGTRHLSAHNVYYVKCNVVLNNVIFDSCLFPHQHYDRHSFHARECCAIRQNVRGDKSSMAFNNHFAHYSLFSYSKSQGNSFSHTCCLYCPAYLTAVAFSDRTRHGMPDEMLI